MNQRDDQIPFAALDQEGDVTDGSVDYYDFDWGEPVITPEPEPCSCPCRDGQTLPKPETPVEEPVQPSHGTEQSKKTDYEIVDV